MLHAALATLSLAASPAEIDVTMSPAVDDEQPRALVVRDDEIFVAGKRWGPSTSSLLLERYARTGALEDESTHAMPGVSSGLAALAVDDEGRLVAAGWTFAGQTTDVLIARFFANGTLDPTFGDEGVLTLDVDGLDDEATAILVDGPRVVIAGRTSLPVDNGVVPTRAAVWIVDADGGGISMTRRIVDAVYGEAGEMDALAAIARDGDGYVAVGTVVHDAGNRASVLAVKLTSTAGLDPSFGGDGVVTFDPGTFQAATGEAIVVDDDAIWIGATVDDGVEVADYDFAIVQVLRSGLRGATFGDDGVARLPLHVLLGASAPTDDRLRALARLDDGTFVAAGDSDGQIAVARVDGEGAPLATFDDAAAARHAPCGFSAQVAGAIVDDGAVVIAGACYLDPFHGDAFLARLDLGGPADVGASPDAGASLPPARPDDAGGPQRTDDADAACACGAASTSGQGRHGVVGGASAVWIAAAVARRKARLRPGPMSATTSS